MALTAAEIAAMDQLSGADVAEMDKLLGGSGNAMESKVTHFKNPMLDLLFRGYKGPGSTQRVTAPNGLERALLPRASGIQDKQMAGQDISVDERIGQGGEGINRTIGILGAGNPLVTGVTGAIEGVTAPGMSAEERLKGGAMQGATQAATSGALKLLGKVVRPFKTVGDFKAGQIDKAAGQTVSGDVIIQKLKEASNTVSPTMKPTFDRSLEIAEQMYAGKQIPIAQASELLTNANTAYTAAGQVGKAATARFNNQLAGALREGIKEVAPGVSQANQMFSTLYKGKGVAKKLIAPAAIAGFLKLLGVGMPGGADGQ